MKRSALVSVFFLGSLLFFVRIDQANAQTLRILSPDQWRVGQVSVWSSDFTSRTRFDAFDKSHKFGGNLTSYDLDGDGKAELIIGAGEGSKPYVQVYTQEGKLLARFLAYKETFLGGVRVAAGDLNGDGKAEIVTAPGSGMDPLVRVFDKDGNYTKPNGFHAYAPTFGDGVHVAVGDVNGDGKAEIVTTPGPGGGPHLRVFDGNFELVADTFAFNGDMKDGITPAIIRTPTGPEIVVGVESWSEPKVKRFALQNGKLYVKGEFLAFDPEWKHGATVVAVDVNGDGFDEIAAHGNGGSVPELRILSKDGTVLAKYMVHDPIYRGGLSVTQIPGEMKIASISRTPLVVGPLDEEKAIDVNLSQQRLYAFEHGRLANTFLVSTGIYKYPTPVVEAKVLSKIPVKTYKWSYGPNHPDNYNLPGVKWNMRFYGNFYIHGAYWHNNFGHRMSHGCVNVSTPNADWIYHWADVGTPVKTHY